MPVTPAKRLSRNEIRANCVEFAAAWADETHEQGEAQTFWNELLACFGVNRRRAGATFERRARRATTGQTGRIDVFWPRVFLAEHKSAGKLHPAKNGEQSDAEKQAFDYLHGGNITDQEFPRYVATSDFRLIQITDLEATPDSENRTVTFETIDLPDEYEKLLFLADGHTPEPLGTKNEVEASQEAVKLMGALYEAILADAEADLPEGAEEADDEDEASEQASVLLTRLLFLMAGDDNGLWRRGLFTNFVRTRTVPDGSDLGAQLTALFDVLNTPERKRSRHLEPELAEFPYVNGGVFGEREPVQFFTKPIRDALLACCDFNWRRISPAIFGSLFQAIKSREARRGDGEHYTSETDILRTLEPLFLNDLRARLDRTNTVAGLRAFWAELGTYRYLDPACGCGNFLVIAYREMRQLELDLIVKLRELQGTSDVLALDATADLKIRLDQFAGIELNWWPAKIAETAMFLVDHQANRRMETTLGLSPNRLPIDIEAEICHANALATDWSDVCPTADGQTVYVFGNPPFAGHKERSKRQADELRAVWGRPVAHLDYVTAWYAKALAFFEGVAGEWAFVSTNSIVMGEGVPALFSAIWANGWRVKFAHRTFAWESEAPGKAAVHVVIVGFTRGTSVRRLFAYSTPKSSPYETRPSNINPYLVDAPDVLVMSRSTPLNPSLGEIRAGSTPIDWKALTEFTDEELAAIRQDPIAAKYLRSYMGGKELINGLERWCLWMDTPQFDPCDITRSPILNERVDEVRTKRQESGRAATQALARTPHLFGERRQPTSATYLAIPQTFSDNRLWVTAKRLDQDVVPSIKLFTTADPDGFLFGVVSSSMFITWQKTVGGRLKSDPSLSSDVVWNTLPLPQVLETLRAQIIAAGQGVEAARALHPERTLAQHYQPLAMDPALISAHDKLDAVVDRAFGASRRCRTESERQKILFERYAELTAGLVAPAKRARGR